MDGGFTQAAVRRDRKRWPYAHALTAADGTLLIETLHGTEWSLRAEVEVSASRITAGQPDRGGKIPGRIDVDGLAEETWRPWTGQVRR